MHEYKIYWDTPSKWELGPHLLENLWDAFCWETIYWGAIYLAILCLLGHYVLVLGHYVLGYVLGHYKIR